ncbi:hypothetical protein ACQPYK_27935 [Streptosporangium sp. CA-135522]|uniref:hypothetical protein n=1 Tax=Streptosporangium sp. CA-135522 TaxID=3240072 RepID=UPI003D8C458C
MSPKIATNEVVSRDRLLEFLRERHRAIVIMARRDGRPQASPAASTARTGTPAECARPMSASR